MDRLRAELLELRAWLDKSFSPETALNGLQSEMPSAGHCAAAAAIAWERLGGSLVSTSIRGMSHWFNRIRVDDQLLDLDITGDQFGYPAIQIKPAEELYPYTRERSPDELNDKTLHRAALLARRAGLLEVAEGLEKRRHCVNQELQYDLGTAKQTRFRVSSLCMGRFLLITFTSFLNAPRL